MKRRWTITLLAIPVAVLVAMLLTYRHHTVPLEQCSELYRRYQTVEGVKASYIKDFPVNDTLRVDVVLLEATTDAGWDTLKTQFNIVPLPEMFEKKISNGEDKLSVRLAPKQAPWLPTDTTNLTNNSVLAISRLHHSISIFYTRTMEEIDIVRESKYF